MSFDADLSLDQEQREQLKLEDGESLRLLQRTGHTLTFERTGGPGATAIPSDRELVLTADVQSFPLADILSLLHSAGKSGFVAFSCEGQEKSVYLHRGEVMFASSNQSGDRLGDCLLRANMITLEALRETEQRWSPPERFGKALVERDALTPRELWNGVKFQVEEIVRSLFSFTTGVVHFWEGDIEPDNVVRLSLPTRRLIAEGLQRRDELLRFLAMLEDSRVVLRRVDDAGAKLSGNGRTVFDALEGSESFADLPRRAGLDPLSAARTIQLLSLVGAVEIEHSENEDHLPVDPAKRSVEDDDIRETVHDHFKLLSELIAPLVMVDGLEPVSLRLGQLVADLGQGFPELLGDLEVGPGGLPDPEQLVRRGRRLPGARAASVAAALGELVSYVEFELKNHPRIEEPDRFIEAVESLRAKLDG